MMKYLSALALSVILATSPVHAGGSITLDVRGAQLADVVSLLASQAHVNIVVDGAVPATVVTMRLDNVSLSQALGALESAYALAELHKDGYIVIVPAKSAVGGNDASVVTVRIDVPDGNAVTVASALTNAVPGAFVSAIDTRTLVASGSAPVVARIQSLAGSLGGGNDYGFTAIPVNFVPPSELLTQLQVMHVVDVGSAVYANDGASQLLVGGSPDFRKQIAAIVVRMDLPARVVTFDVSVLDVTPNEDATNRGITWGQAASAGNGQVSINAGQALTQFASRAIPIAAQINELIGSGHARVLATPRITVASGQSHELQVGGSYPVVSQNGGLVASSTVQYYQTGVILQISANIGANGDLSGSVKAAYDDILGVDPNSKLPIIMNRTDQGGRLPMHDGVPIVISGMFSDTESDIASRIPGLGDIPILGQFFRNRQTSHQRDELLIVLTPHIGVEHPTKLDDQLMQSISNP
jgi:type II secretory pathway component GspD/PulD (secretin)